MQTQRIAGIQGLELIVQIISSFTLSDDVPGGAVEGVVCFGRL